MNQSPHTSHIVTVTFQVFDTVPVTGSERLTWPDSVKFLNCDSEGTSALLCCLNANVVFHYGFLCLTIKVKVGTDR